MRDALVDDLRARFGDDAVSTDGADRSAYAHDLWPRQLLSTRGGLDRPPGPRAVVWPNGDEDLAALTVEAAAMAKVPLAGTHYIPGVTEEKTLKEIKTLLERHLVNPVDYMPQSTPAATQGD